MSKRRAPPMTFSLLRPCIDCPFLEPRAFHLRGSRAAEIAEGLEHKTFACHKTLDHRPQQHCAGALVIMANTGAWGDLQQVAQRLGLFDPAKLDLEAPVYETFDAFVLANGGTPRPWRSRRPRP